ncbi:MAG: hypothetical protein KIS78_04775 [Labilithrix sp.]|nr:hypothetical protein [Labilithrix sp.]
MACTAEDPNVLKGARHGADDDPAGSDPGAEGADGNQPTCKQGAPHFGFANVDFAAGRSQGDIGVDRRRVKPYSALASEFERVLGVVPVGLAASAATYGEPPSRWYAEPAAGAVSLYTTYTLAFAACYDTMTNAKYDEAPTMESAAVECSALQRKAWQRTPAPDEVTACAGIAVGLDGESVARRRWAHACASVLTSAGFTSY